jgi:hypothetical protein
LNGPLDGLVGTPLGHSRIRTRPGSTIQSRLAVGSLPTNAKAPFKTETVFSML